MVLFLQEEGVNYSGSYFSYTVPGYLLREKLSKPETRFSEPRFSEVIDLMNYWYSI